MADFKRLARSLVLVDGTIGAKETAALRAEFLADNVVSRAEAEFLLDLHRSAERAVPEFKQFVHLVVKKILLADGDLTAAETGWLANFLKQDGAIDDADRQFLRDLHAGAKRRSPEFDALYAKYCG
jgi:hypothetical protein